MTGPDRIVPLFSSSSGNATLIKSHGTYILVDCGMSCKMMTKALVDSGVYPDDVSAVFLTHRHSDHIAGVPVFSRKYHTPIYGTQATLAVLDGLAVLGEDVGKDGTKEAVISWLQGLDLE
jgi:phosphoribosyl 1,2-cyclic phosphodiesterase